MRVVADENMPLVAECLAGHEVCLRPGRHIGRDDLMQADALLVRSVTKVGPALLAGTPVRFVGSATIGTDHLDLAGLSALGIEVASAPGCNARAVGEYVVTVLAALAAEQGWAPQGRLLGVVGLGNTGRAVVTLARHLGFRVMGCDPYVTLPGIEQASLTDLLAKADILSLHVPLTRDGAHPTHHLIGAGELAVLPDRAIVINACRGEVVDGAALDAALAMRPHFTAVLDVWEGEPHVPPGLLERVRWGTPHIAGYSQEGKWRGTATVCAALCARFGVAPPPSLDALLKQVPSPDVLMSAAPDPAHCLAELLLQACPVTRDDAALRRSLAADHPGEAFDALRRHYPARREFTAHRVGLPPDNPLWPVLRALGFTAGAA